VTPSGCLSAMLQVVPLMVVETRKEVDEVRGQAAPPVLQQLGDVLQHHLRVSKQDAEGVQEKWHRVQQLGCPARQPAA